MELGGIKVKNTKNRNHEIKWEDESLVTKAQWKEIIQNIEITNDIDFKTVLTVYIVHRIKRPQLKIAEKHRQTSIRQFACKS